MLTDPSFGEEFDTIVDELTDQYVRNELPDDERARVEKYFLNTPGRQQKLEFATELLSHAEAERGERDERSTVRPLAEPRPSLWKQLLAFWRRSFYAHAALTAASLVVVVGVMFFVLRSGNQSSYAEISPPLTTANRAEGPAPLQLKLPDSGLRINLTVPQDARDAKNFRVKLVDGNGVVQELALDKRNDQTIVVSVPAASLTRGSYAIQLFEIKTDGTEERVRGSYRFDIE